MKTQAYVNCEIGNGALEISADEKTWAIRLIQGAQSTLVEGQNIEHLVKITNHLAMLINFLDEEEGDKKEKSHG